MFGVWLICVAFNFCFKFAWFVWIDYVICFYKVIILIVFSVVVLITVAFVMGWLCWFWIYLVWWLLVAGWVWICCGFLVVCEFGLWLVWNLVDVQVLILWCLNVLLWCHCDLRGLLCLVCRDLLGFDYGCLCCCLVCIVMCSNLAYYLGFGFELTLVVLITCLMLCLFVLLLGVCVNCVALRLLVDDNWFDVLLRHLWEGVGLPVLVCLTLF